MTYVLNTEAVRGAMRDLHSRRIHPHFPTYIGLTAYAESKGETQDLDFPYQEYLRKYYKVEAREGVNYVVDGREKEYLTPYTLHRPMWKGDNWQQQVSPGTAGRSTAGQGLHMVCDIDIEAGTYSLHDDHWEDAREYLTEGEAVPAIPVAAFLYRDYAFELNSDSEDFADSTPELSYLEDFFRQEHGFDDNTAFFHLFKGSYGLHVDELFEEIYL